MTPCMTHSSVRPERRCSASHWSRTTSSYLAGFAAVALAASLETRWLQTSVFCLLLFVWPRTSVPRRRHLVSESHRRWLRSSTDRSCAVPRTHNTFGDRRFAVAGPRVWNSLPAHLRDEDITYGGFRRELKTFCFNVASGAQWDFC